MRFNNQFLSRLARNLWPVLLLFVGTSDAAEPAHLLSGFPTSKLIITAANSCILFDVYVAQTGLHKQQGLMHIESLDEYEGMIFIYNQRDKVSMWMKNTLIPLDMIFVDGQGQVATIHRNAVPMSEEIISSGTEVVAVIELNGGATKRFNVESGNTIIFPAR
jgi:hypothetical protein